MSKKEFIDPATLLRDSFGLARAVYDSGYRPDVILVLWRGGTPIGIVVHEFFEYKGVPTYHTVIKAESYLNIEQRIEPRIENLEQVVERIPCEARVLVVDDIFDTGCTLQTVRTALQPRTSDVRIATLYVRSGHNETNLAPDFFVRETDSWLVFPHELVGLSEADIARKTPDVSDLVL